MTTRMAQAVRLDTDGRACPMAHASRLDDSFQHVEPPTEARTCVRIGDGVAPRRAFFNLGAFSGTDMNVCVYGDPQAPALVAYDRDGAVLWASPRSDLPGQPRRGVGGILIARLRGGRGRAERIVYAANEAHVVAYREDGSRLWRRNGHDLVAEAPDGIGGPVALTFTDAGELVGVTPEGWVVKLDASDGRTIHARRLVTDVVVDGRRHRGVLATYKCPLVVGDACYVQAEFRPDRPERLPAERCPVLLVRVALRSPGRRGSEHEIAPLEPLDGDAAAPDRVVLGRWRARGSPSACVTPDGVLVFANAWAGGSRGRPVIVAVEDAGDPLRVRWRSRLDVAPGEGIHAAPGLHAGSGTLLVTTSSAVHVLRGADELEGDVAAPRPLAGGRLVDLPTPSATLGCPFALTYDADRDELVICTNVRIEGPLRRGAYPFLAAFALPARGPARPRPLWCQPLSQGPFGRPRPGVGTYGQPALFRYADGNGERTGVIVNTVRDGTYLIR